MELSVNVLLKEGVGLYLEDSQQGEASRPLELKSAVLSDALPA